MARADARTANADEDAAIELPDDVANAAADDAQTALTAGANSSTSTSAGAARVGHEVATGEAAATTESSAASDAVMAHAGDEAIAAAVREDAIVQAYMNLTAAAQPSMQTTTAASVGHGAPVTAATNANVSIARVAHLIRESMNHGHALASNANASANSSNNSHVAARCPPFRESYSDMGELRRELKVISVRMNVPYYMQHSSPQRLEARCPTWKHRKTTPTTCEFVVSANRHTNGRVYVTRAVISHNPNCSVAQSNSANFISAAALMETAKPFMSKVGDAVRPKDMAGIMKEQFGVSTSYMTAWRALSAFRQQKKNEEGASFMKIRGYLDAFVKSNEGSVAAFEHMPGTTTFSRAFLCPKPLQSALRYCRSVVLFSVFLITSANGGVLMTATTQDAMGENVPIAIGVVPVESEANWLFFLQQLNQAIPDFVRSVTTLVHSRGEDLQRPLHALFPNCVQSDGVDIFAVSGANNGAAAANASNAIPGSSAIAPLQSSFQWIETLCTKTPLMILVGWVSKVASTLFQRFEKYGQISSEYPDEFHALLLHYEAEANHFEVLRIAEHGYEVIDHQTGRQRIVDFAKQSCTCGEYDASRFPCLHVFLAISFAGLLRADVIPRMFLMTSLKALYGGRITPIDVENVASDNVTQPLPQPKTRGRPRKIQQIQQFGDVKQDKLSCSICGVKGHNKRTCKRANLGSNTSNNNSSTSTSHGLSSGLPTNDSADEDNEDEDEEEEPTFLDSTYHQIAMDTAIHAADNKHSSAGDANSLLSDDLEKSMASPSATKRRKLTPDGASSCTTSASSSSAAAVGKDAHDDGSDQQQHAKKAVESTLALV
ncbi:Mutator-like transposase-like protein, partial [Globisporangium splendens]